MAAPYRIVSLDGGGIHGLLTTRLLQRIERERSGFLAQANVFAGTSAGGILALALASSPPERRSERLQDCVRFFSDPDLVQNSAVGFARALTGMGSVYAGDPWYTRVRNLLRSDTRALKDLTDVHVVVPAFELDHHYGRNQHNWRPRIFHNFKGQNPGHEDWFEHGSSDEPIIDAALRSSAAPVVTPVYQGFIDGGVFANNPGMCAITLVMHDLETDDDPDDSILRQICMVSVGSGLKPGFLPANADRRDNWGWVKWMLDPEQPFALLDLLFDSGPEIVDFQCRHLLGRRNFLRVNPMLREQLFRVDLPSLEAITMLERSAFGPRADEIISGVGKWFEQSDWFDIEAPQPSVP